MGGEPGGAGSFRGGRYSEGDGSDTGVDVRGFKVAMGVRAAGSSWPGSAMSPSSSRSTPLALRALEGQVIEEGKMCRKARSVMCTSAPLQAVDDRLQVASLLDLMRLGDSGLGLRTAHRAPNQRRIKSAS